MVRLLEGQERGLESEHEKLKCCADNWGSIWAKRLSYLLQLACILQLGQRAVKHLPGESICNLRMNGYPQTWICSEGKRVYEKLAVLPRLNFFKKNEHTKEKEKMYKNE